MNPQQAYDAWASSYDSDRNLTRDLNAQVTRQVLAGHSGSRVLELGCGTGKNRAFLASLAREISQCWRARAQPQRSISPGLVFGIEIQTILQPYYIPNAQR